MVLGARRTDRLKKIVDEIREAGGTAECRALDVTSFDDMRAFAGFAEEKFGSVDVLINNAGNHAALAATTESGHATMKLGIQNPPDPGRRSTPVANP